MEGPASQPGSGNGSEPGTPDGGDDPSPGATCSLVDDIEDLISDARTYVDAELTYQKSRAAYVGHNLKRMIAFGIAALVLALFAFGALTVGLIIALTPLVTAWGATAIVVGVMLLVVFLLVRGAASSWREMMSAINDKDDGAMQEDEA